MIIIFRIRWGKQNLSSEFELSYQGHSKMYSNSEDLPIK